MGEHKARQAISERRLADALLADEHEGVRHPSAAIGSKERGLDAGMAEELVRQARRLCLVGVALLCTHEAASAKLNGAAAGWRRALTACQMCLATIFFGAVAWMITQRSGSAAASMR